MWKDAIRPFLRPLPQWAAIALAPTQEPVVAALRWQGESADASTDHTVASLRPLVIATGFDAGPSPVLEYHDSASGRLLGVLRLTRRAAAATPSSPAFYHVVSGSHRCLGWPQRPWNAWLQNRAMRKHQFAHGSGMEPVAAQQLMIAYLRPRPVVLVSVETRDGHRNIFPMDLIGPLRRLELFSLALRSTNVSMPVLRDARRVALSCVPAAMKDVVYRLSAQHKQPLQDWNALPFSVQSSREFRIPVVADALHVRELTLVHAEEIGSHMFFLGRAACEKTLAEGAQLQHTAGYHQAYRRRLGEPFTEV